MRDPESGAFLNPESRTVFFVVSRISDSGYQTHVFESLVINFWAKSTKILCKLAQIFPLYLYKDKLLLIFSYLGLQEKEEQQIFTLFCCFYYWIRDPGPGSGLDINQDPG
jgi:hypothetical protein